MKKTDTITGRCPKPIARQSGCKVSWYTYDNEADALVASEWAKQQAEKKWALGYDFGWLVPGEVRKVQDHDEWIVTMP